MLCYAVFRLGEKTILSQTVEPQKPHYIPPCQFFLSHKVPTYKPVQIIIQFMSRIVYHQMSDAIQDFFFRQCFSTNSPQTTAGPRLNLSICKPN